MEGKAIIFFDGICNLCDSFINFVYKRDSKKQFLYAPLQGETAKKHLAAEDRTNLRYIVLFHREQVFRGPQAVQEVFCRLYPKGALFLKRIPGHFLYKGIAKRRYRLFGKKEKLYEPSPQQKEFFLP